MAVQLVEVVLQRLAEALYPRDPARAVAALRRFMEDVMLHESNGTNVPQRLDGPGRGYFQYEISRPDADAGSNKTAVNRALTWFAQNGGAPPWLVALQGRNVDFITLDLPQQQVLFLLDKAADRGVSVADLAAAFRTPQWHHTAAVNWSRGHHKAGTEAADIASWRGSW